MSVRKATINDAEKIKALILIHAKKGKMLPRSLYEIYESIRDFYVEEEKGRIIGCTAIHICGREHSMNNKEEYVLAEIKSLAVLPKKQGSGVGTNLVRKAMSDAKELGVTKVFTLTYAREFFRKLGFEETDKIKLPQKIWSDCKGCIKFPDECDETAMVFKI